MNFELTDDQVLLRDQVRKFFFENNGLQAARKILESKELYDRNLWSSIAELGWPAAAIPECYGGLGLGYIEACVIAEELGRSLAPVPYSSSIYLAAEALLLAGSEQQKQTYLPKIAQGQLVGTFAVAETMGAVSEDNISATFENGVLSGAKLPVLDGEAADIAIVLARTGSSESDACLSLVLVDLADEKILRSAVETVDPTRKQAELTFNGAAAKLLGEEGQGWSYFQAIRDRAAVFTAFEQIGGADTCLEMARDYSMERFAFGKPIAANQAIKHKLVDLYVKNQLARGHAYYAAWALEASPADLATASAGARVAAIQAYSAAARENILIHGGIGYTWEADCHLFYRRAALLSLVLGGERQWKDNLVSQLVASDS